MCVCADHEEKRKRGIITCNLAWESDKNPQENIKTKLRENLRKTQNQAHQALHLREKERAGVKGDEKEAIK